MRNYKKLIPFFVLVVMLSCAFSTGFSTAATDGTAVGNSIEILTGGNTDTAVKNETADSAGKTDTAAVQGKTAKVGSSSDSTTEKIRIIPYMSHKVHGVSGEKTYKVTIPGVRFQIVDYDFYTDIEASDLNETLTTDESGMLTVTLPSDGDYIIRLLSVPDGYNKISGTGQTGAECMFNYSNRTVSLYGSGSVYSYRKDTDPETLTEDDFNKTLAGEIPEAKGETGHVIYVKNTKPSHITVGKSNDSYRYLSDAGLAIYAIPPKITSAIKNQCDAAGTDFDKEIARLYDNHDALDLYEKAAEWKSSEGLKTIALKDGYYVLSEFEAPEGYKLTKPVVFRAINESGDEKIIVNRNSLGNNLTFPKESRIGTDRMLAGEISFSQWQWNLMNYYQKMGPGESLDNGILLIDKKENDIGGRALKIRKTNMSGRSVEGAVLELTRPDGAKEVWTTGKMPKEFVAPEGKYILVETAAPKGYSKISSELEFTVDKNGKIILNRIKDKGTEVLKINDGVLELKNQKKGASGNPPETSDKAKIALWIFLMTAAAACAIAILIRHRKRKYSS